jgi:hypothetical protein
LNWESEGGVWAEICTTVNQGYPDRYSCDEFIVFFDDNTSRIFYPPLKLKPGASVDNRVGGAPAGYFEPVSGFGLIWRSEVEYSENMFSSLG